MIPESSNDCGGWNPRLKETGIWPLYDSWVRYVNDGLCRMWKRRAME